MRWPLFLAAALAASVSVPAYGEIVAGATVRTAAPARTTPALRRNVAGRGVSLHQPIGAHGGLALSASTGPRRELPELRLLLGVQYTF